MLSARISDRSISAQTVAQQVVNISFVFALALGDASNILMGQNIGANKPTEARNLKNVTYIVAAILVILNIFAIVVPYRYIPYLFNITGPTLPLAQQVLLLVAFVAAFNTCHTVQCGMIKAW